MRVLSKSTNYIWLIDKIEEKVDLTEYRDDSKLYSLLKATWIGDYLTVMANLREMLEHRRRKEEQDLFELLDE